TPQRIAHGHGDADAGRRRSAFRSSEVHHDFNLPRSPLHAFSTSNEKPAVENTQESLCDERRTLQKPVTDHRKSGNDANRSIAKLPRTLMFAICVGGSRLA